MPGIGDLLFNLMGQPDPRRQLAASLVGQAMPANGTINMTGQLAGGPGTGMAGPSSSGPPPQGGGALAPTQLASAGGGGQPPPPPQPPQPQAYQSPPDLGSLYLKLIDRQRADESINRGAGLLFGAFAAPQDRPGMLQAMTNIGGGGASNPGEVVGNLGKIMQMQVGMQMQRNMIAAAPTYARQLNMPVEQIYALIADGKLPEILSEVEKNRLTLADPLHQAQTAASQAEVPLRQAQTASSQAEVPLKQAQTENTQTEGKLKSQELVARQKLLESVPQIAKSTGMDPVVLASMPPDKLADMAAHAAEPTEASKNYKQARTELAGQGFSEDQVNTLAPPEMLIAGASADPMFRSYVQQRAAAMKQDPSSPAATQSFEQFKTQTAVTEETAKTQGAAQVAAKKSIDDLRSQYDKQKEIIDSVVKDPTLSEITGTLRGRVPTSIAPFLSGDSNVQQSYDLQAKINQLSKMGFISGAHAVREAVGGRVTQNEAQAGASAENRLTDQSVSTDAYRDAIKQVKEESDRQMAIAYKQAGIPIPEDLPDVKAASSKLTVGTGPTPIRRRVYDSQGNLK